MGGLLDLIIRALLWFRVLRGGGGRGVYIHDICGSDVRDFSLDYHLPVQLVGFPPVCDVCLS